MRDYSDIINLPYKKSALREQMSMLDRAAQFSPFAALTGHKEAASETARLTDSRTELDEYLKEEINRKLRHLIENKPQAVITYFTPDGKKDGGSYVTVCGTVKKYDSYLNTIRLTDNTAIPVRDIVDIEFTAEQESTSYL